MRCYPDRWYDREGKLHETEKCYPYTTKTVDFVGLKAFTLDIKSGILEVASKNWQSVLDKYFGA